MPFRVRACFAHSEQRNEHGERARVTNDLSSGPRRVDAAAAAAAGADRVLVRGVVVFVFVFVVGEISVHGEVQRPQQQRARHRGIAPRRAKRVCERVVPDAIAERRGRGLRPGQEAPERYQDVQNHAFVVDALSVQ